MGGSREATGLSGAGVGGCSGWGGGEGEAEGQGGDVAMGESGAVGDVSSGGLGASLGVSELQGRLAALVRERGRLQEQVWGLQRAQGGVTREMEALKRETELLVKV